MKRLAPPDHILTLTVLVLMGLGLLMVYSASLSISEVRYGNPFRIIMHWMFYIPLGLLIMGLLSRVEVSWWRAVALPMLLAAFVMMIAVLIPGLGKEINGAQRWFSVFGLTLQPVELLKPVIFIYMAYYMSTFPDRLQRFSTGLAPMLVMLGVSLLLLLLQPDFGSSALLFAVCLCMWFVGGVPMRHLAGLLLAFVPLGAVAIIAEPYRMQRLISFMDPWSDPFGSGYQLVQSLIGFGSGGLFGVGLGQGVQKLFYLPEVFTDFISATLAEELGLAGMLMLIFLFAVLLGRGVYFAIREEQPFQRLLVLGCTLSIAFTFFINLGAAMGLLPTKGMPLPFISYGGSALIGNSILIGLMLAVQRHRPENARKGARR